MEHYFYDGRDLRFALALSYKPGVVILSITIACLAAYAALSIAGRMHAADSAEARRAWLIGFGLTVGLGGWAMHFIGLLALNLSIPVSFDLELTLLSIVPTVLGFGFIGYFFNQPHLTPQVLLVTATLLSAGFGGTHYIGMMAMQGVDTRLIMLFEPKLFVLSTVLVFLYANIALPIYFRVGSQTEEAHTLWKKLGAAGVMGLAISGMHYTAMRATYFFPGDAAPAGESPAIDTASLTLWVSLASFLIASLVIIIAIIDRRLQKASQAEQASRAQMFEAIESIADGFSLYDMQDRLVVCNSRYRELMEVGGLSLSSGVPFERVVRNAAAHGLVLDAEGRIDDWMADRLARHRAPRENFIEHWNTDRWFRVSERLVGHFGTVAICTDITELKRAEVELSKAIEAAEQARAAAEEANRLKSAFLANMSHELRTPLNAIIGYSEMLAEEVGEPGQVDLLADLQKIRSAGRHLLALINDVLDLSKIEAGKMEVHLETFDVSAMLQEVISTVLPLVTKDGNRFDVHCDEGLGTLRADLTKVRQALFNLLSNAGKFTSHGVITLVVKRQRVDGADWLRFGVSDTGIGIAPEQISRLFQAFSQADTSTAKTYGGTGLGLVLSRRFCLMMGGDITVKSTLGAGSTFTIHLPAGGVAPKATMATRMDESFSTASTSGRRLRTVLVIDDDPTAHETLQHLLDRLGLQMAGARSGEEGLRLARELRPAVILLDVIMPGMDGWAVLTALKSDPQLASIPVIMATFLDNANLGFALGATDFLTKPINREYLAQLLRKYHCAHPPCPVLVVEDQADLRELVRRMLEQEGWVVAEAENGRVALDRVAENRPELIVLDLMMPEMDGFSFLESLRQHEPWRSIPVIVMTAKDLTAEDHERLNGYIQCIINKGSRGRDELLQELGDQIAACIGKLR